MAKPATSRSRPASADRNEDERIRRQRSKTLTKSCSRLLDAEVRSIRFPGGRTRESYLLQLADGREIIGTERDSRHRALIEAKILRCLHDAGAPVPALLGADGGTILLQEALQGQRLAAALHDAPPASMQALLASALTGLLQAQRAGNAGQLQALLPELGTSRKWILDLVQQPAAIGRYLDVPTPTLDRDALVTLLTPAHLSFIKWDARPGNAMVDPQGVVRWFDWEHAGVRAALDDLVWLLCDEYVADIPAVEAALLDNFVPQFAPQIPRSEAMDYCRVFGTFHMSVRLGLILKYMDGEWWDAARCIERDKVGVTLACARTLCQRGARWAVAHPLTNPLAPWFAAVGEAIERL